MNISKKYNFIYITTNLITGMQYIGEHSCYNLEKDKYLGSGSYLNKDIKKYKKKNFKREILEFFSTKQEAFDAQEKYIKLYNTLEPYGYNLSSKGGFSFFDENNYKKLSQNILNTIIRLHLLLSFSVSEISKVINLNRNKIARELKKLNIYIARGSNNRTDRWRKNMSELKKGKKRNLSPESLERMKSMKGKEPWNKNKKILQISGKNHFSYIKFSKKQIEEIIDLFTNKKLGPGQISRKLNIGYIYIRKILKENNVYEKRIYRNKHTNESKEKIKINNSRYWKNKHLTDLTKKKGGLSQSFKKFNILIIENISKNSYIFRYLGKSLITNNDIFIIKKEDIINIKQIPDFFMISHFLS